MAIARTKTISINHVIEGPVAAPVILFSNSLGANLSMWQPQADHFSDRFRVVRYDQRGHGQSEVPDGPYSFDDLVADVLALADALGIGRFHFVGLSMGGMTALGLALARPDRLLSVTAANCVAGFPDEGRKVWDDRIKNVAEHGLEPLLDATLERWFTAPTRAARPAEMTAVREMVAATPVPGYLGCCAAIQALDYTDRLAAITTPMLFIGSTHDVSTPPAAMQAMQAAVNGSRYVELDAAHVSNLGQPAAFNRALEDFLDSV
ncbi:MAG: 3-oxoadipate enol-lactonase [Gammaproteobacteria bacterium]